MSVALDPGDVGEWTAERLNAFLREPQNRDLDWRRFEIVDGLLFVSPEPFSDHLVVVDELVALLRDAAPAGLRVSPLASVRIGASYRVPDVTVIHRAAFSTTRATASFAGSEVELAIEVQSPSSVTTDRITKPAQYAAAGIAHYWRVELDPLRLITYALDGEVYVETGSWGTTEAATITDPFPVTIDLANLFSD